MGRSRDTANIISNGQQATAWCVFDGTLVGTNAPTDGYNVTSIQRISTGLYQINFTSPMDITTYVTVIGQHQISGQVDFNLNSATINSIQIRTSNTAGAAIDSARISALIFGGKA